jgi:(R,R)-butanediol dehydrogenase / meso-butanediol dehydrogenase / diacetyl reductase
MNALRFQGRKDLQVEDVEYPKSCGPRQVVVKHAYCGWGGMAERCLVYDYNVAKLPPEVSDEQGAMIEPAAVAVNAIEHGDLTAGGDDSHHRWRTYRSVVALTASAAGAPKIFLSEPNAVRREFLKSWNVWTGMDA